MTIWQKARVGWFLGAVQCSSLLGCLQGTPRDTMCLESARLAGRGPVLCWVPGKVLADSRGLGSRPFQAEV